MLALLSVIVTSITLNTTVAQSVSQSQGDRKRAEQLLQLCSRSEERARETMEEARGRGVSVSTEAENRFQEGNRLRLEAEAAFQGGDYAKCVNLSLEAMHQYKASLRIVMESWTETEVETEQDRAIGLNVAIERAEVFIDRLSTMATKAEELGYDVTEIRGILQEASSHLDTARALLADGDASGAAQELGEARQTLSGVIGELNRSTKGEKRNRVERFIENTERLIGNLREDIEEAEGRGVDVTSARQALDEAVSHVNAARTSLNNGDTEGAIESLREAQALLKEVRLALHTSPVIVLGGIDELEEKIKRLEDGLKDLQDQGTDVQEILDLIRGAEEYISAAKEAASGGDRDGAIDSLRQAREIYHEALRRARDLTRPGGGPSGGHKGPKGAEGEKGPRDVGHGSKEPKDRSAGVKRGRK
ncbi:MAG: YfdX family protein [Candidatus Bathyarchaeia archaeon]